MRSSFSTKLMLIPGAAAFAFLLSILIGVLTNQRLNQQIESIEARYLPLIELGPRIEGDLERMRLGFQDAVEAQDPDTLAATRGHADKLLDAVDAAGDVIPPSRSAALRLAVESYHEAGHAVSKRLIAGETGEALVEEMSRMQAAHSRAAEEVKRATAFDRQQLTAAFDTLRAANFTAQWTHVLIAVICLVFVIALSLWIGRGVVRSVNELSDGFARFGEGDFATPMQVSSSDELGEAARSANRMAEKLQAADRQRRAAEWVKTGQAGLAIELRGDLEPKAVAQHFVQFVARHTQALAGAVYEVGEGGELSLAAEYAASGSIPRVQRGEGLLGEAVKRDELMVIDGPATQGHVVRSGLLDMRPDALVFLPISQHGTVTAVAELALARPPSDELRELLLSSRSTVATGLEVARSQAARRELLAKSQAQSARLAEQEERLTRANAELEAQQQDLRRANDELRQQTAELDSFSYSVSHDLRAPLRAIDGFTRILIEDHAETLDDEGRRVANIIRTNTQKMGNLIDDLLAFSRLGRQAVQRARVDMTTLAREAFDEARSAEPARTIELHMGELPAATGDPALLRQVWVNLMANAVKYSRPREVATVEVESAIEDGMIRYTVRDNGVGFDMRYVEKLFAVFQRLHGASEFEGTGVGLALVQRIVQKHNGRVTAESTPGQGATFSFTLPALS